MSDQTEPSHRSAAQACDALLDTAFFKALCDPSRAAVFRRLLMLGRADIAQIASGLPQDRSVVSRHLKILADVGIARAERDSRQIFYTLDGAAIVGKLEALLAAARNLSTLCCPGAQEAPHSLQCPPQSLFDEDTDDKPTAD
ncbi:MAG: ArsR/SmtB family transcription factor [Pannonibacter sp.]